MQTFIVHNRRPRLLLADLGLGGFLLFELLLAGMLLGPLLHVAYALTLIPMALLIASGATTFPEQLSFFVGILVFGHGSAILGNMVGLFRVGLGHLWPSQLLLPLYWLLIGLATLRALIDLGLSPFHWFKTPHDIITRDSVLAAQTDSERPVTGGR